MFVVLAGPAHAAKNVYSAHIGGGASVGFVGPGATVGGVILAQSVFGLADTLDLDGALFVETGAATSCLGLTYALHRTHHWRLNVGGGTALRLGLDPDPRPAIGPYAEAAVRWQFAWGVGLSLGVHAIYPVDLSGRSIGPQVYPTLTVYQDFG